MSDKILKALRAAHEVFSRSHEMMEDYPDELRHIDEALKELSPRPVLPPLPSTLLHSVGQIEGVTDWGYLCYAQALDDAMLKVSDLGLGNSPVGYDAMVHVINVLNNMQEKAR